MTAKQLRDKLATVDDDTLVVVSKDAEGNSYSPLRHAECCGYVAETTWSGIILDEVEDEDEPAAVPCVALWPTN